MTKSKGYNKVLIARIKRRLFRVMRGYKYSINQKISLEENDKLPRLRLKDIDLVTPSDRGRKRRREKWVERLFKIL